MAVGRETQSKRKVRPAWRKDGAVLWRAHDALEHLRPEEQQNGAPPVAPPRQPFGRAARDERLADERRAERAQGRSPRHPPLTPASAASASGNAATSSSTRRRSASAMAPLLPSTRPTAAQAEEADRIATSMRAALPWAPDHVERPSRPCSGTTGVATKQIGQQWARAQPVGRRKERVRARRGDQVGGSTSLEIAAARGCDRRSASSLSRAAMTRPR